jgi:FSR family fosmidomycin resistance protein-like MFS transporter
VSAAASRRPASRTTLLVLSLGHGATDLCSGGLFALLPFLVVERHYSYAAAGVFALVASIAGALFQPLVGAHGDRNEAHWLLPGGLVLAGLGIGVVGYAASFPLTLLAVAVCSIGVAAYHPEGARWARHASSGRVTADMGIFSVGGGVGYALGPLVVAAELAPLGLHGTPIIALIPIGVAVAVCVALRRFRLKPVDEHPRHPQAGTLGSEWRPFAYLALLFCVASAVAIGLLTFVPLFLVQARATSPAASNVMTSVLLAAAAAGTLLGGLAAQRFGRRLVLIVPQLVLVPAIALLPSLSYGAMIPVMIVIGLAMNANVSVALVLAQEYLPARMGLATGLTIGVCGGAGGLIVAALGLFGDAAGPSAVLYAIAAMPLLVAVFAARLPRPAAAPPGTVWSLRVEAEH